MVTPEALAKISDGEWEQDGDNWSINTEEGDWDVTDFGRWALIAFRAGSAKMEADCLNTHDLPRMAAALQAAFEAFNTSMRESES